MPVNSVGNNTTTLAAAAAAASPYNKRAIERLRKFILDNGGSVDKCTAKRDFENEANQIKVKLLGVENFLKDCSPQNALRVQENGFQGLLDLSSEEGNERGLFLHPGVMDVLCQEDWRGSEKIKTKSLEALRNICSCAENLYELARMPQAVAVLIHALEDASGENQNCALVALNNLCCFKRNKLVLFQTPQLVSALLQHQSRLAFRSLFFLSQDLWCQDLIKSHPALLAGLREGKEDLDPGIITLCTLAEVNVFGSYQQVEEDGEIDCLLDALSKWLERRSNLGGLVSLDDVLRSIRLACNFHVNRTHFLEYRDFVPLMMDSLEASLAKRDAESLELCLAIFVQFTLPHAGGGQTADQAEFLRKSNILDVISAAVLIQAWWPESTKRVASALQFQLLYNPAAVPRPALNPGLVVLSFHSEIKPIAALVHKHLGNEGFKVFSTAAPEDGPQTFSGEWQSAVQACRAMLVLFSPLYKESAACQVEFEFAKREKRQMVGLMIKREEDAGCCMILDRWLGNENGKPNRYAMFDATHDESELQALIARMVCKVKEATS